jgi:hypothetical protein
MKLFKYVRGDGTFDYERYRAVQTAGNRRKLAAQWVDEDTIRYLAQFISAAVPGATFGICHGTRRGNEQLWFAKYLGGCKILGTEISDTAGDFPNTVQWDFHEPKPEWVGAANFVYSNSWDHSYDPPRMFKTWLEQLAPSGVLVLEHTQQHQDVTELDPFGAQLPELIQLLGSIDPRSFTYEQTLKDAPGVRVNGSQIVRAKYVVMRRQA